VGYRVNDAYSTYLSMGRPNQLTKQQVEQIKKTNDGSPISHELVRVKAGAPLVKELNVRENDVFFVNLRKGK
jgi:xylan 1,4-beta-xylosidase